MKVHGVVEREGTRPANPEASKKTSDLTFLESRLRLFSEKRPEAFCLIPLAGPPLYRFRFAVSGAKIVRRIPRLLPGREKQAGGRRPPERARPLSA